MKSIRCLPVAVLSGFLLAGCFTSMAPLIGPAQAVFPFEKIVYSEISRPADRETWTRHGDSYSFRPNGNGERVAVRLLPVGEDVYVVQMQGPAGDERRVIYGLLKVDRAKMTAQAFAAIAPDDFRNAPHLARCGDAVCVDNLDAYVAYARAAMASGAPPDTTFRIVSLK